MIQDAGHTGNLYATAERFVIEALCIYIVPAFGIRLLQFAEDLAESGLQVIPAAVPFANLFLSLLLQANHAQISNRLVHTNGVLPVIAATRPFAGILDGYGTVRIHKLLPYFLFLSPYLNGTDITRIHTLVYTP